MAEINKDRVDLLTEAYKQGQLPPDIKAMYEEAVRTGVIPRQQGAEGPSGFLDFFKSIPRGIAGGLASTASAMGGAAQTEMGEPVTVPGAEESRGLIESQITGPLPKPQGTAGRYGETVGQFLGNPASYLGPGGMGMKAAGAATSAFGSEAMGQLTEGFKSPVIEGGARLLGSVLGGKVPTGIPKAITPFPMTGTGRQSAVDVLRREGIEPTAGQVTGNRALRRAEGTLGEAPGSGGAAAREQERIARQFTRAAARRMGEDTENLKPEVIARARDRLSDTFERTAEKIVINHDAKIGDDLVGISEDLMKEGLPKEVVDRVTRQIMNVTDGFVTQANGKSVMDGKTYQALTRKNTALDRAINDPDPNVSYYATRVRSALDDAMERAATARGTRAGTGRRKAVEDLKEARRQWYNMLVLSRAVTGPGEAAAGYVNPQKLRQMLTRGDDAKLAYAAGRGDLHDLARAGSEVMEPLPNSGTAERLLTQTIPGALGGAGVALASGNIPAAVGMGTAPFVPGFTGRAMMSPAGQGYLKNQLLADFVRRLPPGRAQTMRSLMLELAREAGQ